ncbi:sigma factor-like helix-turn-helix DNA-binding protein [Neptuniibacter sp. QD37_11]|uniref:sigma factor-like helix-turn-helix DNA-binding protein n=1 Tax=Neptuniibacter sp. QD37_11 TaxID=3398209 RepID=UPI0039F49EFF
MNSKVKQNIEKAIAKLREELSLDQLRDFEVFMWMLPTHDRITADHLLASGYTLNAHAIMQWGTTSPVSSLSSNNYLSLSHTLLKALEQHTDNAQRIDRGLNPYFRSASADPITSENLELSLLGDLENFVHNLKARDKDIFCLRFGYKTQKAHTLKAIAEKYDVTGERMRQIEAALIQRLVNQLRIPQKQLSHTFCDCYDGSLQEIFPELITPFANEKALTRLLNKLLLKPVMKPVPKDLRIAKRDIANVFIELGEPLATDVFYTKLKTFCPKLKLDYKETLAFLSNKTCLIENGLISPIFLKKEQSILVILANEADGLSLEDLRKALREKPYASDIELDPKHEYPLQLLAAINPKIYTDGEKLHHTKFIDTKGLETKQLCKTIKELMTRKGRTLCFFDEVHEEIPLIRGIKYPGLRAIIGESGAAYGIHLDRQPNADVVALSPIEGRINHETVLMDGIRAYGRPVTLDEIKGLYREKSRMHAASKVQKLVNDQQLCLTPDGRYQAV